MSVAIVTGASGLIGSETVRFLSQKGLDVVGIDNNMRSYFFGADGSTDWNAEKLKKQLTHYTHLSIDIRDQSAITNVFSTYNRDIVLIVHCAAQPSHDWAAKEPITDFGVNALGTMYLLEATRLHATDATFIFVSTNKVYGDRPNSLPLVEQARRYECASHDIYSSHGIDETMSIDQTKHSVFGASKVAADIMCQEYGRYFGLKTGIFRGGCLTGPAHSGAELHGFLSYLVKCQLTARPYTIFGYKGKQVRDNIHSFDLVNAFWHFYQNPRCGAVYNIGGARQNSCSVLEAMDIIEKISHKTLHYKLVDTARIGDHIWWISNINKFKSDYPNWDLTYSLEMILQEIIATTADREKVVC